MARLCLNCGLVGREAPAEWHYEYANPNWPGMGHSLCDLCKREQQLLESWHATGPWSRPEWHVYNRLPDEEHPDA